MVRFFAGACVVRLSIEAMRESVALCWQWARAASSSLGQLQRKHPARIQRAARGSSGQGAPTRSPSGAIPFSCTDAPPRRSQSRLLLPQSNSEPSFCTLLTQPNCPTDPSSGEGIGPRTPFRRLESCSCKGDVTTAMKREERRRVAIRPGSARN